MFGEGFLLVCVAKFVVTEKMEPFIVGGKPAGIQHFGHSAFIVAEIDDVSYVCGSSILNQNVVLTAAHCFEGFNKQSKVSVRAGSAHKLKGSVRMASRLSIHDNYDPSTIENDIALAYIKKPFQFGEYIKRVVIMKNPPETSEGYVAGWGITDDVKVTDTDILHRAKQALWSRDQCRKMLKHVPKGVLCGGAKKSREYAAEGDSGSALVVNNYIQVGLVSFKRPEISNSIVVYTDISYFYNWIMSTSRRLFCKHRS